VRVLLSNLTSRSVIYPCLPLDILGSSVGETEDTIVSMFCAFHEEQGPVVLILDGLEHMLQMSSWPSASPDHLLKRSHSTFLSLLDETKTSAQPGSNLLVLCTSSRGEDNRCARFDNVFYLRSPDDSERRELMESILIKETGKYNEGCGEKEQQNSLLLDLVEVSVGKSYAELVQCCRQTLEDILHRDQSSQEVITTNNVLFGLKERLQTITPESLKSGFLGDSLDLRVFNARDLRAIETSSAFNSSGKYVFPMRGTSAALAWKDVTTTIVLPLCRAKELRALLYHKGSADERFVSGGILLCGEPGTGKSELAIHCARYASYLCPTIKLLEVSCTSLIHKELGGSEKAVKHLFDSARSVTPCILLLEGIENIAAVRGNDPTTEGTLDRVLSTLLTELDGIETAGHEHVGDMAIIGITRDASWIDPALKRPGRLEKTIRLERDWVN
jgi:SpoVK/Ycf46/Vps4 family AAA+-type ATPase